MTDRQLWSRQQQLLRQALMIDHDFEKARPIFLTQHAAVHSAKIQSNVRWSFQDEVLNGLTDEQFRIVPKGSSHSVAWSLWHLTRIEDAAISILLADAPQLLHSSHWLRKLETHYEGVGNELSRAEINAISETINIKALLAYRLAVGKRTRLIVSRLVSSILWATPAPDRLQRLSTERVVSQQLGWLIKYWGGHPSANLLLMPATRHCFVHLNEIQRLLPKLRRCAAA